MAAPTVYRWDDTDAPILQITDSNHRSAMAQLFKSCLVTGYGTKSPPGYGYSLEFENDEGTAIAIKSNHPESNGFYYNIINEQDYYQDFTRTDINYNYVTICENMTDAVTRINQCSYSRLYSSYSYSYYNEPIAWVLIADDRFFYFFSWGSWQHQISDNPDFETALPDGNGCWGDFISPYLDPWSTVLYGWQDSGYNGSRFGQLHDGTDGASSNCYAIRAFTGEVGAKGLKVMHGGGPHCNYAFYGRMGGPGYNDQTNYPTAPFGTDLPLFITRPFITEDNTDYLQFFRGWFPGLYYPCHDNPYKSFETVTAGGKTFMAMKIRIDDEDRGQVLIDLGDWWV